MILITLVIGAIAFFVSMMFTERPVSRFSSILVSLVILLGSVVGITANYHDHYGMKKQTVTTSTTIHSASNSETMLMLLKKDVGTSGKNDVYIYNLKTSQKTPNHTKADEYTSNKVTSTSGTDAVMQTKTTRWVWKSNFYKDLFMWSGMNNTLVKRVNTFKLPNTWVTLTTDQAAALKKKLADPSAQAQSKTAGMQYVQAKVAAAMAKNPSMTPAQQADVTKQATAEFYAQSMKAALASIK